MTLHGLRQPSLHIYSNDLASQQQIMLFIEDAWAI